MQKVRHCRHRTTYASICLLVVVLIYAPLAGAAWASYQSACCRNGQCSIAAHHHQIQKAPAAPANQMECGHEHGMLGMMACAMSCCHDADRSLVSPVVFVLLPSLGDAPGAETKSPVIFAKPSDSPLSIKPDSPPPRSNRTAI